MKPVLLLILLGLLTACASKPNETNQDAAQVKADMKARDEFARSLPKPPER